MTARESFLVLRLWAEPDDAATGTVRGRLLVQADDPGAPLLGVEQVLAAVEAAVRGFARGDLPPWRDGPETPQRRSV